VKAVTTLFDSMDWDDEENDLSTVIGSGTRIASEVVRNDSDSTPNLPTRTTNGKRSLEVDQPEWIRGASSSASSGLGEFACGITSRTNR
jgi:hypothetical protein